MTDYPDYDGVFFGSPELPTEHAIGRYHQDGDLITAEISGGAVRSGGLVGTVDPAGVITAGYAQVLTDGEVVAGRVVSHPTVLPDGRIMLTENWTRMDGSSGVSTIVSLAQPHAGPETDRTEFEMRNATVTTDEAQRPHLLLISTGDRLFREYLLAPIAEHYRIHLYLAAEPSWESQYIDGVTVLPDTLDADAMIAAAAELNARDHIDGVLCWDEARIVAAAKVAQSLGLPGGDPEMILRCRDKHLTRELAGVAGVPQPRSVLVGTADEAAAAAAEIGYPVVLKPRGVAASLGVVLARTEAELREHFAFARDTTAPGAIVGEQLVLVEEYADGPGDQRRLRGVPRRGAADLPGPQGGRLRAVLRRGRPPGRRGRTDAGRSGLPRHPAPDPPGPRLHRRHHPQRVPVDPERTEADRGERPARRRPDSLPGPARHRHRPGPGRSRGGGRTPTRRHAGSQGLRRGPVLLRPARDDHRHHLLRRQPDARRRGSGGDPGPAGFAPVPAAEGLHVRPDRLHHRAGRHRGRTSAAIITAAESALVVTEATAVDAALSGEPLS